MITKTNLKTDSFAMFQSSRFVITDQFTSAIHVSIFFLSSIIGEHHPKVLQLLNLLECIAAY